MLLGFLLHIVEATNELLVCMLKGIVWIDVVKSCSIDETEKEITILSGLLLDATAITFAFEEIFSAERRLGYPVPFSFS